MKCLLFLGALLFGYSAAAQTALHANKPVLVVHGGAGTILKDNMTPAMEEAYTTGIAAALTKGYEILRSGGAAVDAVEAAVKVLEDNPLFNAGKGAVFTHEGRNELDASIMDGSTLKAGAVAGVTTIKNPVAAARAVMDKTEHVLLTGSGAERFAADCGLELVTPDYFFTEPRWRALQHIKQQDSLKKARGRIEGDSQSTRNAYAQRMSKIGTVGAVALDQFGNLAAATSTGGMTNKRYGRVGDSPIIGAGTYASNATCAISCTGWGEYFIRLVMAKTVSDMMEFGKMSLQKAAHEMIMKRLPALGGDGGMIAVDKNGNITLPFNTEGMYRGFIRDGKIIVKIYKE